jgi:RNA recognition motif-containing protein
MNLNEVPVPEEAATLFLGDLSVFCTEKDIRKLFRPFGTIEAIRVKRGTSNKTNLSYGFIRFTYPDSAEQALKHLNGIMFLGRALK